CGFDGRPAHRTDETRGSGSSHSATARAVARCAAIRDGSVSTPCRSWNAACGESAGPMSRSCSERGVVRNPYSPKLAHQLTPPYDGTGSVICGNLPLPQSNRPDSTTTPPSVVPCPPRNLVAEWITMSAPCSIGRTRYGVASVASTTSGTPAAGATSARPARSATSPDGLATTSV